MIGGKSPAFYSIRERRVKTIKYNQKLDVGYASPYLSKSKVLNVSAFCLQVSTLDFESPCYYWLSFLHLLSFSAHNQCVESRELGKVW